MSELHCFYLEEKRIKTSQPHKKTCKKCIADFSVSSRDISVALRQKKGTQNRNKLWEEEAGEIGKVGASVSSG